MTHLTPEVKFATMRYARLCSECTEFVLTPPNLGAVAVVTDVNKARP